MKIDLKGWRYIFIRHKNYLDKGRSTTSLLVYLLAFFGFASRDTKLVMILGSIYFVACYFFGMWWYKIGLVFAENEVSNQNDNFEQEVRKHIKTKKFK